MDLLVLNKSLDVIAIVDVYESIIWTERYYEYGDFELYTAMTQDLLNYIKTDNYIQRVGSDRVMIIEEIRIDTDSETGNHITITGRSLESILDRRVIWSQTTISGNLQNGIKKLVNENIISPSKEERKISNFIFKDSTDSQITGLTVEAQYTGDNLYDVISKVCEEKSIGFKVSLNENKQFVFELYAGADRSYEQTNYPYVVFSPNFDNIINSNYLESKEKLKNVALVGGEGEGTARKYLAIGNTSGLDRRELFVDARDISSEGEDGQTLTTEQYNELLKQRGNEYLADYTDLVSFEGAVETNIMYKYGVDFFDGDIVQIANEYGHEAKVRILEVVISENEEGNSVYPTFKTITEEGEETE